MVEVETRTRASGSGRAGAVPSLLTGLRSGRLDMRLLAAFPEQDASDRTDGDAWVARAGAFVGREVDPDELDRTGAMPVALIDALRSAGFLTLGFGADLGGAGLSPYNVLRVLTALAARSVPVGQLVAIQAGLGVGALYPVLPDGPLRDRVRDLIRAGALCGFGDTDAAGQNNRLPRMTATRAEDGSAFVLHGEKLFTGNGPVADLLAVSAVVDGRICVCVLDPSAAGFSVESRIDFLGSKGFPSGALRFDGVRVASEHVLAGGDGQLRLPPAINSVAFLGRVYLTGAPAIAAVRNCLAWSRDFVNRRSIDHRPLSDYDRIQRMVAATMADAYAMDSLARWCLIGSGLTDRWLERFVAKNVLTTTAWRAVDRTVSLMGAEGLETVASKRRRGAAPLPVERALRDTRVLRTAGNVDFQLDSQVAQLMLAARDRGQSPAHDVADVGTDKLDLSPRNQSHLAAMAQQARRFATLYDRATLRYRDPATVVADEEFLVTFGRIAAELVTVLAVLSRTSLLGTSQAQNLADVHCTRARHRLASLWRALAADEQPDYRTISQGWLTGSSYEFLTAS